jgi:hypothetical protein
MSVTAAAYHVPEIANTGGRELVLAIIGGTTLTLALTRPKLAWVERLIGESKTWQAAAQQALSIIAFGLGGYAYASLFLTLQKQVSPETAMLIKGAAWILFFYAWAIHFEPFVPEWQWPGEVIGSTILYTGWVYLGVMAGVMVAAVVAKNGSPNLSELKYLGRPLFIVLIRWTVSRLLKVSTWVAAATWLLYGLGPRFMGLWERAFD